MHPLREDRKGMCVTRTAGSPSKREVRAAEGLGYGFVGGTLPRPSWLLSLGSLDSFRCFLRATPACRVWAVFPTTRLSAAVEGGPTSSPSGSSFVGRAAGRATGRSTLPEVSPRCGEVRGPWRRGSRGLDTERSCGSRNLPGRSSGLAASSFASTVPSGSNPRSCPAGRLALPSCSPMAPRSGCGCEARTVTGYLTC